VKNKMIDWKIYRTREWNPELGENYEYTKKAILAILKEQKVSLSKVRCLFIDVLRDIEDKNIVSL